MTKRGPPPSASLAVSRSSLVPLAVRFVIACSRLYRIHNYSTSVCRADTTARRMYTTARRIKFCVRWLVTLAPILSLSGRRFYKKLRCWLSALQQTRMSRACPGGLGQAPAMRICCRRTTHRRGIASTSPSQSLTLVEVRKMAVSEKYGSR